MFRFLFGPLLLLCMTLPHRASAQPTAPPPPMVTPAQTSGGTAPPAPLAAPEASRPAAPMVWAVAILGTLVILCIVCVPSRKS